MLRLPPWVVDGLGGWHDSGQRNAYPGETCDFHKEAFDLAHEVATSAIIDEGEHQ